MNQILHLKTSPEIKAQLENFPKDLNEAYETIFDKIEKLDGDQPTIAKRAFQWLLASGGIETCTLIPAVWQNYDEVELQQVPAEADVDYILDSCQHLIINQNGYCTWSHISVREYLEDHKQPWVKTAESTAGGVCLLALNDENPSREEDEEHSILELKQYSNRHWPNYAKALDKAETDSRPRKLLRDFLGLPLSVTSSPFTRLIGIGELYNRHAIWPVCGLGLESSFKELYAAGLKDVDVEQENLVEFSLLDMAIQSKSAYIAECFLKLGAKPTERTVRMTEIHAQTSIWELLLKYSDSIDCVSVALESEKGTKVGERLRFHQRVLEIGKERKGLEWYDCFRLRQKILEWDEDGARSLLEEGVNPDYYDPAYLDFDIPLVQAVKKGDASMVQTLLEHHADPDGVEQSRPICCACMQENLYSDVELSYLDLSIVQLLLDHGADPNKRQVSNNAICVALQLAITSEVRSHDLLSLLLERGANPNAVLDLEGDVQTVLSFAVKKHCEEEVLQLLVDNGAHVDGEGETLGFPLKAALFSYRGDSMVFLIENGADASKVLREWVEELKEITRDDPVIPSVLYILRDSGGPVNDAEMKSLEKNLY
jgi:hypothetical protein